MVASPTEDATATDGESRLFDLAAHMMKKGRASHARHAFGVYQKRFPQGSHAEEVAQRLASLPAQPAPAAPAGSRGLVRTYADGQMVFCEHEPGDELYIIKSGKVEILKITPPEEILLSILREGDIFGELSIVSSAPRSATAVCAGETSLLPVSRQSLLTVFGKSPSTVGRILAALSQRLWFTFIRLRAKVYENPLTRTYVLLENKLLEERVSLTSTRPHILALGIGEILGMAGVPADQVDAVKDRLTDDPNLAFQFRQVTIESPNALESKARYFRTRDHLGTPELKATAPKGRSAGARIGLDPKELRVQTDTLPDA